MSRTALVLPVLLLFCACGGGSDGSSSNDRDGGAGRTTSTSPCNGQADSATHAGTPEGPLGDVECGGDVNDLGQNDG